MNSASHDMYYASHHLSAQPPPSAPSAAHYANHSAPSLLHQGPPQYTAAPQNSYPYGYANGLSSSQPMLPLPAMSAPPVMSPSQYPSHHGFDSTGQIAPQGMKPRVTATLWEDEGSLCFQVESKGICVARREDNHMINGTKLLNVAGMTRGRRDGILKSEKMRHVVKIGPMHLKGVWIPFERALDFANKEKITELLYPLFVHNIGALLYHPTNQSRTNAVMAAAERRKQDQSQMRHAQQPSLPSMQHQQPPHHLARPALDRPHAFPTPPTSASSVLGAMNNQDAALPWGSSNMASAASNMPMDGNLAHPRSMPTTPATTPPGSAMQSMPNYPSNGATYDHTRTHMYSAAPAPPSAYAPAPPTARYPPAASYVKNEMAPPLRGPHDPEATEYKDAHGYASNGHAAPHDADHAHDSEYAHDAAPNYDAGRGSYAYTNGNSVATEHPHLSPDMGSPTQSASGRATPRTSTHSAGYYGHQTGYTTPPRNQPASSNLYNVISHERGATNGSMNGDTYTSATDLNGGLSNGYVHAAPGSNKRSRDDDDDDQERPSSRGPTGEMEGGLKRRRTIREGSASGPVYETSLNRSRTVVGPRHR